MNDKLLPDHHDSVMQRIERDLLDSYDEELEMEIDDTRLAGESDEAEEGSLSRQAYFRELLRLQGELVKLQDWVQHHRKKVVIVFEGRDAAGKGGVIKRITQ
ncbi:MAG: polyphosphate kinase 2, partial [Comamonadaceae bacterium]